MEVDKTIGAVAWMDLTVPDGMGLRDFYQKVTGWKSMDISMGEYNDFCMLSPGDDKVRSGICHARGANAGIPPSWIIYVNVENLDDSMSAAEQGGGEVVHGPRNMGASGRYCIVKDPAGAYCGLFQHLE